ncbi:MAG: CPBP family intramembrane glutamic endopeptidase [Vulcanimicrobiaceae bacterium]
MDRSDVAFFVLVFALSIPFWLLGAVMGTQLVSGVPLSGLGFVCPAIAASALTYRARGGAETIALLRRSFDFERIPSIGWYVPVVLLAPVIVFSTYAARRSVGMETPLPHVHPAVLAASFAAFFVAALGEELGWSGYAIDRMQTGRNALVAAVLLGAIWALWHFVPLAQAHRPAGWIAWWSLGTLSLRVLIVWLYNNTGKSVFAASLLHASANVGTITFGAVYDPHITSLVLTAIAAAVTAFWGAATLSTCMWRRHP